MPGFCENALPASDFVAALEVLALLRCLPGLCDNVLPASDFVVALEVLLFSALAALRASGLLVVFLWAIGLVRVTVGELGAHP